MIRYSINDLEKITDIKAHTIRMWEKRYGIVSPKRTSTNIRYYLDKDVKKLLNISTLKKYGLRISKIMELGDEEINEKILELTSEKGGLDAQINNLFVSMIEFDEDHFEKTVADSILKIGFEDTITNILYPFLHKVGVLWQVGSIIPAQEHFASNLIRRKLLVVIEAKKNYIKSDAKTFLLFLPEKELHEIGLLFCYYIIRKYGHKVIYLGQDTPFNDLIKTKKITGANFLMTHLVSPSVPYRACEYIENISKTFPDITIFVAGKQACKEKIKDTPENIFVIREIDEFKKMLDNFI